MRANHLIAFAIDPLSRPGGILRVLVVSFGMAHYAQTRLNPFDPYHSQNV
jgi:hypothetical protein